MLEHEALGSLRELGRRRGGGHREWMHAPVQREPALRGELGSFERVRRVAKVTVFVASSPGFTDQPKVANGASDVLADVLGDAGRHAREAVGVAELPLGASVEMSLTVELEP